MSLSDGAEPRADILAVEEPLEIRVDDTPLTVTMSTPGGDLDLAAGFLFTEGLLPSLADVREIRMCDSNVAAVTLQPNGQVLSAPNRSFLMTSACGVCGKNSIDPIRTRLTFDVAADEVRVQASALVSLPGRLRAAQKVFASNGRAS